MKIISIIFAKVKIYFHGMTIYNDIDIKKYTTFGVRATAKRLVEYGSVDDLRRYFASNSLSEGFYVIGGGSNILFSGHYSGTLLHPVSKGVSVVSEDEGGMTVRAEAGEVWDDFVGRCVDNGWYGLENLSFIPGTVGASAVQNIGAYGAEAGDFIESVEVYDPVGDRCEVLPGHECAFGYRSSIFKQKRHLIVMAVSYRLSRTFTPRLEYANLRQRVEETGVVSALTVRQTVTAVRSEKLPDPAVTGSGGSFFKNPVVEAELADRLSALYPQMPRYDATGGVKIPAGWLIEQAGWKGYRHGDAGVYPKQALVLVNYGSATGKEVVGLAARVAADVKMKFGIELVPEIIIL